MEGEETILNKRSKKSLLDRYTDYFYASRIKITIGAVLVSELLYAIIHIGFNLGRESHVGFLITFLLSSSLSYFIGGKNVYH